MKNRLKWLKFSQEINSTITFLKQNSTCFSDAEALNIFVSNITKYLTALKCVAENNYDEIEKQNFLNSINRIFLSELIFSLKKDIEAAFNIDSKKVKDFNYLLECLKKDKVKGEKLLDITLKKRLVENLDFLDDIRKLRNAGQHFTEAKVENITIKDEGLLPYISCLDKSDFMISSGFYKHVIRRIKSIFADD